MTQKRLELIVGLFVLVGLALLGTLLLKFSKGSTLLSPKTYTLQLHAPSVEGLKERAQVLLAGVQVGSVSKVQLAEDGKSVTIGIKIFQSHKIYQDAIFKIEAGGFLGDKYVAIHPTTNALPAFVDGGEAQVKPGFDLNAAADAVLGFVADVHGTLSELRSNLLNEKTLAHLSATFSNADVVSSDAITTVRSLNSFIDTNRTPATLTLSNLDRFAGRLDSIASDVSNLVAGANSLVAGANGLVATNSPSVSRTLQSLESSGQKLEATLADLRAGKGAVGELFSDPATAASVSRTVTNLDLISGNLSITTSNLNRFGLWRILFWKPKPPPATNAPTHPRLTSPKDGFD